MNKTEILSLQYQINNREVFTRYVCKLYDMDSLFRGYAYDITDDSFKLMGITHDSIGPTKLQFCGQQYIQSNGLRDVLFIGLGIHAMLRIAEKLGFIHNVIGSFFNKQGIKQQLKTHKAFLNLFTDVYIVAETDEDELFIKTSLPNYKSIRF